MSFFCNSQHCSSADQAGQLVVLQRWVQLLCPVGHRLKIFDLGYKPRSSKCSRVIPIDAGRQDAKEDVEGEADDGHPPGDEDEDQEPEGGVAELLGAHRDVFVSLHDDVRDTIARFFVDDVKKICVRNISEIKWWRNNISIRHSWGRFYKAMCVICNFILLTDQQSFIRAKIMFYKFLKGFI